MRLPRSNGAINWRYAVGELILKVAGVLIALDTADWNESRQLRHQELALLAEIRSSLLTDLAAFESGLQGVEEAERQIVSLHTVLQNAPRTMHRWTLFSVPSMAYG
jgi:hypothetical protein